MKNVILVLFLLLFYSCIGGQGTKRGQTDTNFGDSLSVNQTCEQAVRLYCDIPQSLSKFIQSDLKNYQFVQRIGILSDMERNFFQNNPQATPFSVHGDFNGDDKEDYVLVMADNNNNLFIIAITSIVNKYKYQKIVPSYYGQYNNKIEFSCEIAPKGSFPGPVDEKNNDGKEEVYTFKNDGFSISYWDESMTISYYMKNGKFERVLFD